MKGTRTFNGLKYSLSGHDNSFVVFFLDWGLVERLRSLPGEEIIKAARNMGYPMGLWIERVSEKVFSTCRAEGTMFEEAVSAGVDPRTL